MSRLSIGENDQGNWGSLGSQGRTISVEYFADSGEFIATVNTESGSNQGYRQVQSGEIIELTGAELGALIDEVRDYILHLEDGVREPMIRAWMIASNHARKWLREQPKKSE